MFSRVSDASDYFRSLLLPKLLEPQVLRDGEEGTQEEEGGGAGERHEFQVVHIARAGKKAMERMAGLPRGDG